MTYEATFRSKTTEPDWDKIIDVILASKQAEEWVVDDRKDKFGLNEYYLSEHTLALDILEHFDWDEEFFKQHPELKAYLHRKLEYWWEGQVDDDDVFEGWFLGNKITVHPDAYVSVIDKILRKEYCKRIKETHRCSKCKVEISEVNPYPHQQHIYRVGVERIEGDKWRNELFCKKCFEVRLKDGRNDS